MSGGKRVPREPTAEMRERAKHLLGNLTHYMDRRAYYDQDIETLAWALADAAPDADAGPSMISASDAEKLCVRVREDARCEVEREVVNAAYRPKPFCRDCADEDGICPSDGEPCHPYQRALGILRRYAAPDADAGRVVGRGDAEQAIQDALKALYSADIDETDKRKIELHLINADAWCLASRRKYDDHIAKLERRIEILSDNLRWVLPMAKGWAHDHPVGSNAEIVAGAEAILQGDDDA